jgi:predicted RNase H-like nuclease
VAAVKRANAQAFYCCDPVIGDDPGGLYVDQAVAAAVRDMLVPLADMVTPNRFELGWLTGRAVTDPHSAAKAGWMLGRPHVLATSVPHGAGWCNVWAGTAEARLCAFERRDGVPHGVGDLFAGLAFAALLDGADGGEALGLATARIGHVIDASAGRDELDMVHGTAGLADVKPAAVRGLAPPRQAAGTWAAGVDGCPGGWFVVARRTGAQDDVRRTLCETFEQVLDLDETQDMVAVDIPIGLPDRVGTGGRACGAVAEPDYGRACAVNLEASDPPRKVSRQCFALFAKIREVDALMTPALQGRVFEAHPELSFWALNGQQPLALAKTVKSAVSEPGLDLRRRLLEGAGFPAHALAQGEWPRRLVGPDDIVDACALAWSAERLLAGTAVTLPARPPRDGRGLRMEINA